VSAHVRHAAVPSAIVRCHTFAALQTRHLCNDSRPSEYLLPNRCHVRAGFLTSPRTGVGIYERQQPALLAMSCPAADPTMVNEIMSNHECEMLRERRASRRASDDAMPAVSNAEANATPNVKASSCSLPSPMQSSVIVYAGPWTMRPQETPHRSRDCRGAVDSFTVQLRDIGTAPERVLIALSTVINNRSLVAIAPHVADWKGNDLRQKASTWVYRSLLQQRPILSRGPRC